MQSKTAKLSRKKRSKIHGTCILSGKVVRTSDQNLTLLVSFVVVFFFSNSCCENGELINSIVDAKVSLLYPLCDCKFFKSTNLFCFVFFCLYKAILAGSPAAKGVSVTDMTKRLQMEKWKTQMLRNLNMFVSRVRLVVHNLPPTLDDSQLREIFKKHAGPKALIQEVGRICLLFSVIVELFKLLGVE